MAATVNNRRFSQPQLAAIFRVLDTGGTRADVRATVRRLQDGRGVSNDTIKALRELHRRLRRSQGYNVKVGGTRNLIDPETGQLRSLRRLPARRRIAVSRRPRPPVIEGIRTRVTVEHIVRDSRGRPIGRQVNVFTINEDEPVQEQVARAAMDTVEGTFVPGVVRDNRGLRVLQVRSDI